MNKARKTVSVLLIAVLGLAMSGCFASGGVSKAFENTAKGYGIIETEKHSDLTRITAKLTEEGSGYYVTKDEKEATRYYQAYFNARKKIGDINAQEFRCLAIREMGEKTMQAATAFTVDFGSKDDAKDVYDAFSERLKASTRAKNQDIGEEKDYSYTIAYSQSSVSQTVMGLYLEDKSVTYLQATSYINETNAFAEYFCRKMKYKSPMDIVKEYTIADKKNSAK